MELCFRMGLMPSSQLDHAAELALLERCRRQDAEAFSRIVDAYQNRLYGFIKRMVPDAEEAADIAQEVFVRAFQSIGRFDGRSSIRTWLFRIAHNLCVDRARRSSRAPSELRIDAASDETEALEIRDDRWDPQEVALSEEMQSIVEAGIAGMSDKLRTVLVLHDREEMAYEDIAKVLDIPVGTVKSRLFLARAHLQNVLGPYLRGEVIIND